MLNKNQGEEINEFESFDSYKNLPILKRFIDNYFKQSSQRYDLFSPGIKKASNLNIGNYLGKTI